MIAYANGSAYRQLRAQTTTTTTRHHAIRENHDQGTYDIKLLEAKKDTGGSLVPGHPLAVSRT